MKKNKTPLLSQGYNGLYLCAVLCLYMLLLSPPMLADPPSYTAQYSIYKITRPDPLEYGSERYELRNPRYGQSKFLGRPMPEEEAGSDSEGFETVPDSIEQRTPLSESPVPEPEYYVKYVPGESPEPEELAELRGAAFNILCKNREVWFRVDPVKVQERFPTLQVVKGASISDVLDPDKDMDFLGDPRYAQLDELPEAQQEQSYQDHQAEFEAEGAEIKSLCFQSTDVLRHVSVQFGHASLEVNETGFDFKSWFKSWNSVTPWQLPPVSAESRAMVEVMKPKAPDRTLFADEKAYKVAFMRYEASLLMEGEQQKARAEWLKEHRASRPKTSIFWQYWPDWFDHILMDEEPFMHEQGDQFGNYEIHIQRKKVEEAALEVKLTAPDQLFQTAKSQFWPTRRPAEIANVSIVVKPGLLLPYHVILGKQVGVNANQYTHTPFARPRTELGIKPLKRTTYRTHYQPEVRRVSTNSKPEYIKAMVYDFEPEVNDVRIKKLSRQPRITYWVGLNPPYQGQLLGRRILYRELGQKPIQCSDGSTGCYFSYPRYRGIEYRIMVYPKNEQETEKEQATNRIADTDREKSTVWNRSPRLPKAPEGMNRQQRLDWHSQQLGAGTKPTETTGEILGELVQSVIEHLLVDYVIPAFMDKMIDIHNRGMIPGGVNTKADLPIPATTLVGMLRKMKLIN